MLVRVCMGREIFARSRCLCAQSYLSLLMQGSGVQAGTVFCSSYWFRLWFMASMPNDALVISKMRVLAAESVSWNAQSLGRFKLPTGGTTNIGSQEK